MIWYNVTPNQSYIMLKVKSLGRQWPYSRWCIYRGERVSYWSLLEVGPCSSSSRTCVVICLGPHAGPIHRVAWSGSCLLVFTCMAILLAQFPKLNSISRVSLPGAVKAIAYFILIWALPISKDRPNDVSYHPLQADQPGMEKFGGVFNAIGMVVLSFRGHNVILEIQVRSQFNNISYGLWLTNVFKVRPGPGPVQIVDWTRALALGE